mgnify:FL=1|jgi:hypothetical protein
MLGEWIILAISGAGALAIVWVAAELGRDC